MYICIYLYIYTYIYTSFFLVFNPDHTLTVACTTNTHLSDCFIVERLWYKTFLVCHKRLCGHRGVLLLSTPADYHKLMIFSFDHWHFNSSKINCCPRP